MKSWRAIIPFSVFCAAIVRAATDIRGGSRRHPRRRRTDWRTWRCRCHRRRQDGLAHGQMRNPRRGQEIS